MRILFFALCFALFGTTAVAQSIVLRPAVVPLKGQIGQSVTQTLTLQNHFDEPLEFEVVAQDVVVRGGKRVYVEAGQIPGSIAATAVITPSRLRVLPHQSASAQVMYTLPRDMQHRAVITIFKGATIQKAGIRQTTLSLGALFTFQVSDSVVITGKLETKPPTASSNARFSTLLVNEGSEPAVPSGLLAVVDAQGRMVGKTAFSSERLLPGEKATVVAEFGGELDGGDYRAIATFDIDSKPLTLVAPLSVP